MKKILVVDDDLHIQKLYKEELEEEGYEVVVAGSGAKAMELFIQENPGPCYAGYIDARC